MRTWPEGGPAILWTVAVGRGYGGPVAKGGKVYLLDRDDAVGDHLRCFDLSGGQELWNFQYDAPGSAMFPGSRSVPTIDGNHIYSYGHNGDLYCVHINTHKPVWNVNVWTDFGGKPVSSGRSRKPGGFPACTITQCPLVYGDLVIVASQAPDAGVAAFNKLTGVVKWKTPSLGNVGYVSPAIVKIDGYFYAQFGTNNTRDGPMCMHMNGEIMWKSKRDPDFIKGSMILADGLILATDGAKTLYLIEPNRSGFKPLASAKLLTEAETKSDDVAARVGGIERIADGGVAKNTMA